jgi:SMI1-KNR4 cell-wall
MTSDEFHELVEEYGEPVPEAGGDRPLTLARIAAIERERGIKFPAFYKEFLSRYGAGYIRDVLVLSPDSKSEFKFWETSGRVENRECNFMGVMEYESDYYGFLIEQGVCSNDIWHADHDFGYEIADSDYTDFFDLLAKLGLGFWDDDDEDGDE